MALPRSLSSGLLPSEIEYVASTETEVSIVPLVAFDRVRLLGGIYGPFRPPAQTKVPLWLAAYLKRRNKCVIVPPNWITVEALTDTLRIETNTARFAEVPFHYVAVAKVLLDVAADDIPSSDQVRALLKDLREARQSKIMAGLEMINPVHLEMTNISALEIAELRPFFSTAFRELRGFQRNAAIANGEAPAAAPPPPMPMPGRRSGDLYGAGGGDDYGRTGGDAFDFGLGGGGGDAGMDFDTGDGGGGGGVDLGDDDFFSRGGAGGAGQQEDGSAGAGSRGYTSRGGRGATRIQDDEDEDAHGDRGEEGGQRQAGRRSAAPVVEEYEMD